MQYGYIGADLSQLIEKYEISEEKIKITFLDKRTHEMPFTEENEIKLLNQMVEQARRRDESAELKRQIMLKNLAGSMLVVSTMGVIVCYKTFIEQPNFTLAVMVLGNLGVLKTKFPQFGCCRKKVEELKKYRLYLLMMEKINRLTNLNINKIDNISLKNMEKISTLVNNFEIMSNQPTTYSLKK